MKAAKTVARKRTTSTKAAPPAQSFERLEGIIFDVQAVQAHVDALAVLANDGSVQALHDGLLVTALIDIERRLSAICEGLRSIQEVRHG